MKIQILIKTIEELFANGKGILAMDESTPTCNNRFKAAGIPETIEMRRKYRQLIIKTPHLNESIGGAILCDETIRQLTEDGEQMANALIKAGIIPGIKVDAGTISMAGFPKEKVTQGLDGLRERLQEYKSFGARFAKWRAVIKIDDGIPTTASIEANVYELAMYAALCQEADMVPIVEPEVLMEGDHTIDQCYTVTEKVLKILFNQLYKFRVDLNGIILKPNMVIAGIENKNNNSADEIAQATINCFLGSVPASVPAIAFLSGGQSPIQASENLNAINKNFENRLPWKVSFSFGRAIQQPALGAWKGQQSNIATAQKLLLCRAKIAAVASLAKYIPEMEQDNYFMDYTQS